MQTLSGGAKVPFFCDDIPYYFDLTSGNFSPIEDAPVAFDATTTDIYIKNGFLVKNATENAGYIYAVTWRQYKNDGQNSLNDMFTGAAIVPRQIYLLGGEWTMTPVVKVFAADDDQEYDSTVTTINIGTIR